MDVSSLLQSKLLETLPLVQPRVTYNFDDEKPESKLEQTESSFMVSIQLTKT